LCEVSNTFTFNSTKGSGAGGKIWRRPLAECRWNVGDLAGMIQAAAEQASKDTLMPEEAEHGAPRGGAGHSASCSVVEKNSLALPPGGVIGLPERRRFVVIRRAVQYQGSAKRR
jgi:hypothetical protein